LGAAQNLVDYRSGIYPSICLDGLLFNNLAPADEAKRRFAAYGAANARSAAKICSWVNQGRIIAHVDRENQALRSAIINTDAAISVEAWCPLTTHRRLIDARNLHARHG
jgi:hypothetical protein